MEKLYKAIEEVVECIKNSKEYMSCITLKNKMSNNEEIVKLVNEVKSLQKKYVKSNYDDDIKKQMDQVNSRLCEIPIYVQYLNDLEMVNLKIELVKDSLNEYFYKLLNINDEKNEI